MKNSEKHRPSEVMFQFLEQLDISPGDVIQQQGSRDLWAVSETEDSVEAGVLICFEVKVKKLSARNQESDRHLGHTTVTVQGSVNGGLVVNSPNAVQNVAIQQHPELANACRQLRELLSDKRLADLEREDGLSELNRLEQLTLREKSPDILERAKNRIESLRTVFSSVQDIAVIAGPSLALIWQYINK